MNQALRYFLSALGVLLFSVFVSGEDAKIKSVIVEGTNLVLVVESGTGARKLTIESKQRASTRNWEPRAIRRVNVSGEQVITVPLIDRMELLRLRADTNDVLPAAFFAGSSTFPPHLSSAGSTTGSTAGSTSTGTTTGTTTAGVTGGTTGTTTGTTGGTVGGTTATSTGGTTAGGSTGLSTGGTSAGTTTGTTTGTTGSTPAPVIESDIWKISGEKLYFFNQKRGLQKIDIANPSKPVLESTYLIPFVGEQMYLLPGNIVILLARKSSCDSSAGRVLALDMSSAPKVLWEHSLPGPVLESRLIGTDLFVAINSYHTLPNGVWENGTFIHALDVADPASKKFIKELFLPGNAYAVSANDRFFFVAKDLQPAISWSQQPAFIQFNYNGGTGSSGFAIRLAPGTNTFEYRTHRGTWIPAGQYKWTSVADLTLNYDDWGQDQISFIPGTSSFTATYVDDELSGTYSGYYSADGFLQNSPVHGVAYMDIGSVRAAAPVIGHVTTSGIVRDKFKIHERDNILTAISATESNFLETFSLADLSNPKPLGKLTFGIWEQLYATRFSDDKAYIVTFRRTDPLWIIDLKDPKAPRIAGELVVPGWSTFIEPMGDKLLTIGFGDNFGQRVAVSLFDVHNPAAPILLDREFIGTTRSSSESTVDEKAFGFVPEAGLILVPYEEFGSSSLQSKVQLLDFTSTNVTLRGSIAHSLSARRSAFVGNSILSISSKELLSVDASDRTNPKIESALSLARYTDEVLPYGEYLLEFALEEATGTSELRVSRAGAVLTTVTLPNIRIRKPEIRGNLLYLANAQPNGVFGSRAQLRIFDLTALPELKQIGELTFGETGAGRWQPMEFLWPAPGILAWVENESQLSTGTTGGYTGTTTATGTGGTTGGFLGGTTMGLEGATTGGSPIGATGSLTGGVTGGITAGTTAGWPDTSSDFAGRTLRLTYGNGGGERFDFTSASTAVYEQGSEVVTFDWNPSTARLIGTRRNAAGNLVANYDIQLTFNAGGGASGSATVRYSDPSGTQAIDPATFTITPSFGINTPVYYWNSVPSEFGTLYSASKLWILNVSNPARLQLESSVQLPRSSARGFSRSFTADGKIFTSILNSQITTRDQNGLLLAEDRTQLAVTDLSTPSDPVLRRLIQLPGTLMGVAPSGTILYTVGPSTNLAMPIVSALAYDGTAAHLLDSRGVSSSAFVQTLDGVVYTLALGQTTRLRAWTINQTPQFETVKDIPLSISSPRAFWTMGRDLAVYNGTEVLLIGAPNYKPAGTLKFGSLTDGNCSNLIVDHRLARTSDGFVLPLGELEYVLVKPE